MVNPDSGCWRDIGNFKLARPTWHSKREFCHRLWHIFCVHTCHWLRNAGNIPISLADCVGFLRIQNSYKLLVFFKDVPPGNPENIPLFTTRHIPDRVADRVSLSRRSIICALASPASPAVGHPVAFSSHPLIVQLIVKLIVNQALNRLYKMA